MTVSRQTLVDSALGDNLSGGPGSDRLVGGFQDDLIDGGSGEDVLVGSTGNDGLLGRSGSDRLLGGSGNDILDGGGGDDILTGGTGDDQIVGGQGQDILWGQDGVDTLTGSQGFDRFGFNGNLFSSGIPALAGTTGIRVLNRPDTITDFEVASDSFALKRSSVDLKKIVFAKGRSNRLNRDANIIALRDSFSAAGAAARALADNPKIKNHPGAFLYFNTTLGIARLVYSSNLGQGGDITVLANLTNLAGDAGRLSLADVSARNFTLS